MNRALIIVFVCIWSQGFAQEKGDAEFKFTKFDFGEIKEVEGPVTHKFEFTNTGNTPLIIKGVRASCGCTTPAWTKEPVLPGEVGFIQAQYNPRNRPGVFRKSLTVTTDGDVPTVYLYINGSVVPRPRTMEDDFKVKIGATRFKSRTANVGRITTEKVVGTSIEWYNDSDTIVTIGKGVKSPEFIQLTFEPQMVGPKEKGKIIITYDPNFPDNLGHNNHSVNFNTDESNVMIKYLNVVANITEYFPPLSDAEKMDAPQMNIQDRIHNFGKLKENTIVETEFVITNAGKRDLNIRQIKSNCACITTSISSSDVRAGGETKLKVTFDATKRRGNQIKSINIYSNDPQDPTQTVTIKASVQEN